MVTAIGTVTTGITVDTGTHRWNTATFGFRATNRRLRRLRLVRPHPRLRTIRNPDRTTALVPAVGDREVPVRAQVRDKLHFDDSFENG